MLGDVLLYKIEQHDSHFKALSCGCGLEAVVKICWDIDVHSFDSQYFFFLD